MYRAYCNDQLLFHQNDEGLEMIDPVVSAEINKSGSFKFSLAPVHPFYDAIAIMRDVIRVYDDGKLIFSGRPFDIRTQMNTLRAVECEGRLAYLNDTVQRPYSFSGSAEGFLAFLLERHNADVEEGKRFKPGKVTVDYGIVTQSSQSYGSTLDTINEKLLDVYGGYLVIRDEADAVYLDYMQELADTCAQGVDFGENMLDVEKEVNAQDAATAVIPLGAALTSESGTEEQRTTVEQVNGGKDFIFDEDAVSRYGWIYRKAEFDTSDPAELLRLGKEDMEKAKMQNVTVNVTAVDLHLIDRSIDEFDIGVNIPVKSGRHGLDGAYLCTKKTTYLLKPDSNKLELGYSYKTFTDRQNRVNSSISGAGTGPAGEEGRKPVPLLNGVEPYSAETVPTYKKTISLVELTGSIRTDKAAGTGIVFGLLPVGYRPFHGSIHVPCRAGTETWMLTISGSGEIRASEYSGSLSGTEELTFHAIYMI